MNPEPDISADEALQRLKDGNARFLEGKARFPTVQKEVLANLARAQHPFATVIGCSDSRVPPEGRARTAQGIYRLVGAICDIETAKVRFLDKTH